MNDRPKPNPYRPRTRAPGAGTAQRPVGLLIAAVLEAWTLLYTAITAPGTLSRYREMLAGFGADAPAATRSVLAAPGICWFFAALAVAQLAWIVLRKQPSDAEKRRMKTSLWTLGAVFGVVIAWAIYGLYAALFALGKVV